MEQLTKQTNETFAAGHAGNIGNVETLDGGNNTTDFTLSSTSETEYTHTRITITPSVATSRIWVCYAIQMHINMLTFTSSRSCRAMLHRYVGTTDTDLGAIASMRVTSEHDDYTEHSGFIGRIDHPDTTSAVRYSMYMNDNDSSIVYWQHNYCPTAHGVRGFAMELIGTPDSWER